MNPTVLLQVRGLQAELAAERAARGDAQAALEALVRQQPPAAPATAAHKAAAAAAAAAGPDGSARQRHSPHSPGQSPGTGGRQHSGDIGEQVQRLAAQLDAEQRRLQQAQRSNAALRADLRQHQEANMLLRARLEAERAAAAATQAADAAEMRQLAERLQHIEAARDEAVQARSAATL